MHSSKRIDLSAFNDDELQHIVKYTFNLVIQKYAEYLIDVPPSEDAIESFIEKNNNLSTAELSEVRASNHPGVLIEKLLRDHIRDHYDELQAIFKNQKKFIDFSIDSNTLGIVAEIKKKSQQAKEKSQEFTKSYTPRISVKRLLQKKSDFYIKTIEKSHKSNPQKNKKIIVHLPRQANVSSAIEQSIFYGVMQEIFTLYQCNQGKIIDLESMYTEDSMTTAALKKMLNDQHKDLDDYYIIDYAELMNLGLVDTDKLVFNKPLSELIKIADLLLEQFQSFKKVSVIVDDLSGLNNKKFIALAAKSESIKLEIRDKNFDIKKIKIDPDHVSKTTVDFTSCVLDPTSYNDIISLRKSGVRVLLNPQNENDVQQIKQYVEEKLHEEKRTHHPGITKVEKTVESYDASASFIEKTGKSTEYTKSLLNKKGPVHTSLYRKKVLTDIIIKDDQIAFVPYQFNVADAISVDIKTRPRKDFDATLVEQLSRKGSFMGLFELDQNSFLGTMSLSTEIPDWIPLKCLSLEDELVLLDKESSDKLYQKGYKLDERYVEKTRQYFIRIRSENPVPVAPERVDLFYAMTPTKKQTIQTKQEVGAMPYELKKAMMILKDRNERFADLFVKCRPQEKIKKLLAYCKAFDDKKEEKIIANEFNQIKEILINAKITSPSIHTFMTNLCLGSGSCVDRSRAFMAMAIFFGIPAHVNSNETHEFVEYCIDGKWVLDNSLGGTVFENEIVHDPWKDILKKQRQVENQDDPHEFASSFKSDERVLKQTEKFEDWYAELRSLPGLSPFLEFKDELDALSLHSCLMQQPNHVLGENYFYIDSPEDFDQILHPLAEKDGDYVPTDGPLLKLIQQKGEGTLLINWSRFTPTEILNYKSILDKKPSIAGVAIPPTIKAISINHANNAAISALKTRTQRVAWPRDLPLPTPKITITEARSEAKETPVDLYESDDWESILVGQPKIKSEGIFLEGGEFQKALKTGHIHLTGLPDSDEFKRFLDRAVLENGFYANGKFNRFPDELKFYTHPAPKAAKLFAIWNDSTNRELKQNPTFYINQQNYESLFEQISINKKGEPVEQAGLLSGMPDSSVLIVTDDLDTGAYRKIKDEIAKLNPPRTIHLFRLPHVAGETVSVKVVPLNNLATISQSSVIVTADVKDAVEVLKTKVDPSEIFTISDTTQFSDLFENAEKKSSKSEGKKALLFNYEKYDLYRKLKEGETIILRGSISSELYHQLESLFAKPPYLMINGKQKMIQGKLILAVTPNKEFPRLFDSATQYSHTASPVERVTIHTSTDDQEMKTGSQEPLDEKLETEIHDILEESPFVELQGPPGVGKTHFISHLKSPDSVFWEEKSIVQWLTADISDPTKKKYLLIDEANMKPSGYWDFLQDLEQGKIYYKGKPYSVDPAIQKIIFTGNPPNFPRRHMHPFLESIPKVEFKAHAPQFLMKFILEKLEPARLDPETENEIAKGFVFAYTQAKRNLPYECLSIRDIRSLVDKLNYPDWPANDDEAIHRAHLACQMVFAGLFKNNISRETYLKKVDAFFRCEIPELTKLPQPADESYYLPESRQIIWHHANQMVERCGSALEKGSRSALLIEGPSGMGKTEMMLRVVAAHGFVEYDENNANAQKVFFHMTMGSENSSALLHKAYELSKSIPVVLVLDEFNLLKPEDEELFTAILEGRPHKNDHEAIKNNQKFNLTVLATQNPQLEAGQGALSHSLLNRFDRFYEYPYVKEDLLSMCYQSGKFSINSPNRAERFIERYLTEHHLNPSNINQRTFFEELKKLPKLTKAEVHQNSLFHEMEVFRKPQTASNRIVNPLQTKLR